MPFKTIGPAAWINKTMENEQGRVHFLLFNRLLPLLLLIHSTNPQSLRVGIIVFAHVVRPSVCTFQIQPNKATGNNVSYWRDSVGLAEWIMDDACLVSIYFFFADRFSEGTILFHSGLTSYTSGKWYYLCVCIVAFCCPACRFMWEMNLTKIISLIQEIAPEKT